MAHRLGDGNTVNRYSLRRPQRLLGHSMSTRDLERRYLGNGAIQVPDRLSDAAMMMLIVQKCLSPTQRRDYRGHPEAIRRRIAN